MTENDPHYFIMDYTNTRIYDLADGSLQLGKPRGIYDDDIPIYSAEQLLNDMEFHAENQDEKHEGFMIVFKKMHIPNEKIRWLENDN